MGPALPHRSVRGAGPDHQVLPGRHRGHAATRRQQWTCGVAQHQGPVDRPPRLRVPLRSRTDRPLRAHPWRSLSAAARPTGPLNGPTVMPEDPFFNWDPVVLDHRGMKLPGARPILAVAEVTEVGSRLVLVAQ